MVTTFCVSGAVLKKAGVNVNTGLSGGTVFLSGSNFIVDTWINDAESIINSITRNNWVADYSALNANVKDILRDAAASYAAMNCINYDMSGFTSRLEAQTMLDFLRDCFSRDLETLKQKENETFMTGA